MAMDRYTKLVLTVIAVCLVWLSVGGPSMITPVSAQADGVLLRGWIDESGAVISFPKATPFRDCTRRDVRGECESKPRSTSPLPTIETSVPYY
jgi:hypothetical protein